MMKDYHSFRCRTTTAMFSVQSSSPSFVLFNAKRVRRCMPFLLLRDYKAMRFRRSSSSTVVLALFPLTQFSIGRANKRPMKFVTALNMTLFGCRLYLTYHCECGLWWS